MTTRIAHLTDIHLDGTSDRRARLATALQRARSVRNLAHLVLTGDLTESRSSQFDELADALKDWPSGRVTIVPGNHDGHPEIWDAALSGSLARFRPTSRPGAVVRVGDALIVAISTQVRQRLPLGAQGRVDAGQMLLLWGLVRNETKRAVIIAMHHPPLVSPLFPLDGLVNYKKVIAMVNANEHVHVLCGHDHRILDVGRVHTAASVAEHPDPLRVYDVAGTTLTPVYQSAIQGQYLQALGV